MFVADTTFTATKLPKMGETVKGDSFEIGPGGKGSNQAIAAARLGAQVTIISRLGSDEFSRMADKIWLKENVRAVVKRDDQNSTGAAFVFVDKNTADNAIIVTPGAAALMGKKFVQSVEAEIKKSKIFITQLEQPLEAAEEGLKLARKHSVLTILNPAPGRTLSKRVLKLCDFITPNESEATLLTGIEVNDHSSAELAARKLQNNGASSVIITLGEQGALVLDKNGHVSNVKSFKLGPLVETTGAGDCFNGALAVGIIRKMSLIEATKFACLASSISVTRKGTAFSMPFMHEIKKMG